MGPAAESRDEKRADLELDQDLRFLRRDWRAQRVGWAAMLVVVALALSGALGRGALASHEEEGVRFDRVMRHEARSTLEVLVPGRAQLDGVVTVSMDAALLEVLRVERIEPEPERVRLAGDQVSFDIVVGAHGGIVRFDIKPEESGRARGSVSIGAHRIVPVDVLVLP